MAALFPRWTNTVARVTAGALLATPVVGIAGLMLWVRTPYATSERNPVAQPVEFDHRHHVVDDGIDCRYCHQTVETGPSAGIPSTSTCMNCHSQVWNKSPLLEYVRQQYFADKPIPWKRVHSLPQFVYFNHSIHVNKGVGCITCHGRVDQMAAIQQMKPLTMEWCLDCHRNPAPHLRPRDQITRMTESPEPTDVDVERLAREYGVHTRTSCTTCHR